MFWHVAIKEANGVALMHGSSSNPTGEFSSSVVLAIGNVFEFNNRHADGLNLADLNERMRAKANFSVSAEMALFWGGNHDTRVVLLPELPDLEFVHDIENALGISVMCISPVLSTGWVCRDTLSDLDTLNTLCSILGTRGVTVIPWGASQYCYELIAELSRRGVSIEHFEGPSANNWQVTDFVDSKVGARCIMQIVSSTMPDFGVPPGYICKDREEAALLSHRLITRTGRSVVLKSNRGDGGKGVVLYSRTGQEFHSAPPLSSLLDAMSDDDLWKDVPIIVEEAIGGGVNLSTPSYNGVISPDGAIAQQSIGSITTLHHRYFLGMEMGRGAVSPEVRMRVQRAGEAVGKHIYGLGYVGWYNVDFLSPLQGTSLFGSEINARRTGSSFGIDIATRLFGYSWQDSHYVKSHERLWLQPRVRSYQDIAPDLRALNERHNGQGAGVVPVLTRSLTLPEPYLGYLVYGPDTSSVQRLERELHAKLPVVMTSASHIRDNGSVTHL